MDLSVSRVGEGVASAIASGVGDGAGRASSLRAATPIKFKAVRRINVLISNRFLLAGPRPVKIFDKQPDRIAPQLFFGCLLSWRNDVDRYDCSHPKRWSRNRALTIPRSEEHTSELQSPDHLVCRLLLEKKKIKIK